MLNHTTPATADPAGVLVVEDERRLRDELLGLLAELAPDLGPVRVADSAEQAVQHGMNPPPQVAFLDIRLPGRSGLELARELPDATRIVFVTAHDEFAVQAFERGAVDYLLKPLSRDRLQCCLERLRERLTPTAGQLRSLLAERQPAACSAPCRWLTAQAGRRTRLIAVQDIIYLQSDHKYTRIVSRDGEHLIEEPIKNLLPRLDPLVFRQVHRSTVVNLQEVLLVERDDDGAGGVIHLRGGQALLRISAPFLRELKTFLI